MYAVIDFAGHQYKVAEGQKLKVNSLSVEPGKKITADKVLLTFDDKGTQISVGSPTVSGASVELKVLENKKDTKVRVFKMNAKKRYRRNKSHRQHISVVEVMKISAGGSKSVAKPAAKAANTSADKPAAKKAE
jgi:large subunit ribosomal protein L21